MGILDIFRGKNKLYEEAAAIGKLTNEEDNLLAKEEDLMGELVQLKRIEAEWDKKIKAVTKVAEQAAEENNEELFTKAMARVSEYETSKQKEVSGMGTLLLKLVKIDQLKDRIAIAEVARAKIVELEAEKASKA
jgi:serine/threonine protein phosphatase PrpC